MKWDQIVRELKAAGLTVIELPGWKTRKRPGPFAPKGVLCHHTGGTPDSRAYVEWMAYEGRPEDRIPAPLCQIALSRKGVVYMCAGGRANHAGKTKKWGTWLKKGDGNTQLVGIEAMNTGKEGWSKAQYDAYVTLAAVICKVQGWGSYRVLGHKETSVTGKWDPGLMNMGTFRGKVADRIKTLGQGLPDTGRDWLDMASKEDVKDAFREVLNEAVYRSPNYEKTKTKWSLAHIIDWMGRRVHGLEDRTATKVWGFPLNDPLNGDGATVKAGDALRSTRYHSYQGDLQTNDIPGQVWTHEVKNSVYGGTSKVGDVVRATHRAATVAADMWPEDDTPPDSATALKDHEEESK